MLDTASYVKKQILFAFFCEGEKLAFLNDNVIIRDADGKIKHQSTCYRLFALYVVGHTVITTGLIQRANKFGFSIVLMTPGFRVYQVIGSRREGNTLLREIQYKYNSMEAPRHLIANKLHNQRETLNLQRQKTDSVKKAIDQLYLYESQLQDCCDIASLMGVEGTAAKVYFLNHFNNVEWVRRAPRIKADWINSVLDVGYTILFSLMESLLGIYGFDLYRGVLHKQFYMRKSLVCDLVEPFRSLIDIQIRKSINLGQFKIDDFKLLNRQYQLKWEKSSVYTKALLQALLERREDIFRYVQAYYRAFMRQKSIELFPAFYLEKADKT